MTEKNWSDRLSKLLTDSGCFVQRIESGSTGRGIPDMFVVTPKCVPIWIENKVIHPTRNDIRKLESGIECKVKIPWRPGQLAWHDKIHNAISCLTLTRVAGSSYVLVTVLNTYVGGIRNDLAENIATVRPFNMDLYYGVGQNDTVIMRVDEVARFIATKNWN